MILTSKLYPVYRLVLSCVLISMLLGCSTTTGSWTKPQGPFFVVRADGDWCTWNHDATDCAVKSSGTYLLDRAGQIVADDTTLPENDPSTGAQFEDVECPDLFASAAACSPNKQEYAIIDPTRYGEQTYAALDVDPGLDQQWSMHTPFTLALQKDISVCDLDPHVVVAVVDTGVSKHEDLSVLPGKSFIQGTENDDIDGHGTHVAGTCCSITGNYTGVASIGGGVQVLPVRFLGPQGGSTFNTVRSIDWVTLWAKNHPDRKVILNASFGAAGRSRPVEHAIRDAIKAGVIVVVAAGNDGKDLARRPSYPASLTTSHITVGSHSKANKRSRFSNYGKRVDVYLPGENIISTCVGNSYCVMSGTSMATPYAAGAIARIACGGSSDPKNEFLVRYGQTGTHLNLKD